MSRVLVTMAAAVGLLGSAAQAQDVTLDAVHRGSVTSNNGNTSSYTGDLSPYTVGSSYSGNVVISGRSWLQFDVPAAPSGMQAVSASLRLWVPAYAGVRGGPQTVSLHRMDNTANAPAGQNVFDDLGQGGSFGDRPYTFADNGTFTTIPLNADGLAALNASLGGSWFASMRGSEENHVGDWVVFGGGGGYQNIQDGHTQLLITWGGPSTPDAPEIDVQQPSGNQLTSGAAILDFGLVNANSSYSTKVFTVINRGAADLLLGPITVDGANAGDFTVDTTGMTTPLAGSTFTTFSIRFAPSAVGPRQAVLHIASNDSDENPFNIALTGTGRVTSQVRVTVDAAGRGLVDSNDKHRSSFTTPPQNDYRTGLLDGDSGLRARSFMLFVLPAPPPGLYPVAATLRVYQPAAGLYPFGPQHISVHEVANLDATASSLTGATAPFTDLGEGPEFGIREYTGADAQTYTEIPLNDGAMQSMANAMASGSYWAVSLRNEFEDKTDSFYSEWVVFRNSATANVEDGRTQLLIDYAGTAAPGIITGILFEDLNQNGYRDFDAATASYTEPALSGVTVKLDQDVDGTIDFTTVTDAAGRYTFTGLPADRLYQVVFDQPPGFAFTHPSESAYILPNAVSWTCGTDILEYVPGKYDSDGKQDILCLNAPSGFGPQEASLIRGYGDGTFSTAETAFGAAADEIISSLQAADFDGDGQDDVVMVVHVTAPSSNFKTRLIFSGFAGPGSSATPPVETSFGALFKMKVMVGDLNGDGVPDALAEIWTDDTTVSLLPMLYNRATGTWTLKPAITQWAEPSLGGQDLGSVAFGDLNADGKLDLLVGSTATDRKSTSISRLLGNGDGSFGPPASSTADSTANNPVPGTSEISLRTVAAGDFNNDGKLDAIASNFAAGSSVADSQCSLVVALGDGTGWFSLAVTTYLGKDAVGEREENYITVADLNSDGRLDAISNRGRIWYGDGAGGFVYSGNVVYGQLFGLDSQDPIPGVQTPVALADFNGDHTPDLVGRYGNDSRRVPNLVRVVLGHSGAPLAGAVLLQPGEEVDIPNQGLFGCTAVICAKSFYDANGNGLDDDGQPLAGWPITLSGTDTAGNAVSMTQTTGADGRACFTGVPVGTYTISSAQPGGTSRPTTPASLVLNVTECGEFEVSFGSLCLGSGGGLTRGFWSNKNGQALIGADDLAMLSALNLKDAKGKDFNPSDYKSFRTWILNATSVNMAYMLSAQLAAMELNVYNGMVSGAALIYAPGVPGANALGYASVSTVMAAGNTELGLHPNTPDGSPYRSIQEAIKNALDWANNNRNFVQATPCSF